MAGGGLDEELKRRLKLTAEAQEVRGRPGVGLPDPLPSPVPKLTTARWWTSSSPVQTGALGMLCRAGAGKEPGSATAQWHLLTYPGQTRCTAQAPHTAQPDHTPLLLGPLLPPLQGTPDLDSLGMEHQRRGAPGQVTQNRGALAHQPQRAPALLWPGGICLPGQGCNGSPALLVLCRLPPGRPGTLPILSEEREVGFR